MPPIVITNIIAEHHDLQAIDVGAGNVDIQIHRGNGDYETIYCCNPGDIVGAGAAKVALQMVKSGIHEGVRRSTAPARPLPGGVVFENDYTLARRDKDDLKVIDKATQNVMFILPRESTIHEADRAMHIFFRGHGYEKRVAADAAAKAK